MYENLLLQYGTIPEFGVPHTCHTRRFTAFGAHSRRDRGHDALPTNLAPHSTVARAFPPHLAPPATNAVHAVHSLAPFVVVMHAAPAQRRLRHLHVALDAHGQEHRQEDTTRSAEELIAAPSLFPPLVAPDTERLRLSAAATGATAFRVRGVPDATEARRADAAAKAAHGRRLDYFKQRQHARLTKQADGDSDGSLFYALVRDNERKRLERLSRERHASNLFRGILMSSRAAVFSSWKAIAAKSTRDRRAIELGARCGMRAGLRRWRPWAVRAKRHRLLRMADHHLMRKAVALILATTAVARAVKRISQSRCKR